MALITYEDKVALNENASIPAKNKVSAGDMNEIKNAINNNSTYTTSETLIGEWMGKPLYRKVIDIGNLPNTDSKQVAHNISNIEYIAKIYLSIKYSTDIFYNSNMQGTSTMFLGGTVVARANSTNIQVSTNGDFTNHDAYAIIEYTKTTD